MLRKNILLFISSAFIILWVYTGVHKIMDHEEFSLQTSRSPFIENISGFVAIAIPLAEIILTILLVLPKTRLAGFYGSFFLMLLFTGYIWLMLNYAYDLPCSCGGIISKMSWDDHLIFNAAFSVLALAGILLQSKQQRALLQ